jgi:tRNA G37 N-methylase Trm5
VGDSGDTLSGSVMVELELEESDDNTTYTDCANAALENATTGATGAVTGTNLGTFAVIDAPTEDSAMFYVRYVGSKRYSRVVVNKTGTIETTFRTFPMEVVAGEDDTRVEVSHNGARFQFDFRSVYWNSRLQHEHEQLVHNIIACAPGHAAAPARASDCRSRGN